MNSKFINAWKNKLKDKSIIVDYSISSEYGHYAVEIHLKDLFMKRIKPPRYVYHKTSKEVRDSILKNGLIPSKNEGEYGRFSYDKPFVFASIKADKLFSHRYHYDPKDYDIWIIDTTKIDNIWFVDFNFPNDNNHIITETPVPVSALKRVTESFFKKNIGRYMKESKIEEKYITLYHGTSKESAMNLIKNGWQPNSSNSGSNMGQSKYLYLTSEKDDAIWFANEKGENNIVEVKNIPISALIFDPEDGDSDLFNDINDAIEKIKNGYPMPIKFALTKSLSSEHFRLLI